MNTGWQTVHAGQLIGTYSDGTEERVPEDGMLVFPKSANKLVAGKNLYYLAKKIDKNKNPGINPARKTVSAR